MQDSECPPSLSYATPVDPDPAFLSPHTPLALFRVTVEKTNLPRDGAGAVRDCGDEMEGDQGARQTGGETWARQPWYRTCENV